MVVERYCGTLLCPRPYPHGVVVAEFVRSTSLGPVFEYLLGKPAPAQPSSILCRNIGLNMLGSVPTSRKTRAYF